jgi:hypothetical protein
MKITVEKTKPKKRKKVVSAKTGSDNPYPTRNIAKARAYITPFLPSTRLTSKAGIRHEIAGGMYWCVCCHDRIEKSEPITWWGATRTNASGATVISESIIHRHCLGDWYREQRFGYEFRQCAKESKKQRQARAERIAREALEQSVNTTQEVSNEKTI